MDGKELDRRITQLKAERDQVNKEVDEEQADLDRYREQVVIVRKCVGWLRVQITTALPNFRTDYHGCQLVSKMVSAGSSKCGLMGF